MIEVEIVEYSGSSSQTQDVNKIEVVKYNPEFKSLWNNFVVNAKNGSFLYSRDYMEYHSNRFEDLSLMFFQKNSLISVLPAHIKEDTLFSHEGLTYGGIITNHKLKTRKMLGIFSSLVEYLKNEKIRKLRYKLIPHIYHIIPAEEDIYALFINEATLIGKDFTACIPLKESIAKNKKKKAYNVNKAINSGILFGRTYDFKTFWSILEGLLAQKYHAKPVHTLEEMKLLAERFPNAIKLFGAFKNNVMIAGALAYESNKNVVHIQYQAISEEGKFHYALDFIYSNLIDYYRSSKKYLDFGSSIIREKSIINLDLLNFKESLGSRIVAHDVYEIEIL